MLDFIPFIPSETEGLDSSVWVVALQSWTNNFAQLLTMPETEFLSQVTTNTSLVSFIDPMLLHQLDNSSNDNVDPELLKLVFLVYSRLASITNTGNIPLLLSTERLVSFILVYFDANATQVDHIVSKLANLYEPVEQNLLGCMSTMVETIQSLPDLLSKATKTQAPSLLSSLDRAQTLVHVFSTLLSATLNMEVFKSNFGNLDTILLECYHTLIPVLITAVEKEDNPHHNASTTACYLIKTGLVNAFNAWADMEFFIPLGYQTSREDKHQLDAHSMKTTPTTSDQVIDRMSEKILEWIETSGLESPKTAFIDAPLILDWQVEYTVCEKLEFINRDAFSDQEERIEFLKLSMEQVKDSNSGTGSWGAQWLRKKQQRQQQKVYRPPAAASAAEEKEDTDMEIMAKISQVHDLFQHLGDGFIEACLMANDKNAETVIMQLLDDSLPPSVAGLDRSMERKSLLPSPTQTVDTFVELESETSADNVLATRRNVYDNDDFDVFNKRRLDMSKVYVGKKNKANADALLDDKSFIQNEKANVLQRVVDMYDDDYDDSYDDINDAGIPTTSEGGGGDTAVDIVRKKKEAVVDPSIQHESVLVQTFVDNKELFNRDGKTRRSVKRTELRNRTGLTDEQLEGWALMFDRNPRKTRILDKYMLFDGNQAIVSENVTEAQKESNTKQAKKPPVSESRDRAYKDKNKAKFANHNRKSQRDKKIAKAGPPPS